MKRASIAVAVLVALTLTGCAGTADDAGDASAAPVTSESPAPEETTAPLVAETPSEASTDDAEAVFIEKFHEIRATMPGDTFIPNATDEQLIAAGREGCERLDAGETSDTISLVDGETKNGADYYSDSGAILTAARQSLCPENLSD